MNVSIRKLEAEDAISAFDCGDTPMNEYLHRYARKNQAQMFGITYVCIYPPKDVIGFYTVANTTIPRDNIPADLLKGLPKYQDIPAILLGRLAVDRRAQGKKIGELLISHCFDLCLHMTKLCGARYVITDAYQSAMIFYKKYNFRPIQGSSGKATTRMFVDLSVVRSALTEKQQNNLNG